MESNLPKKISELTRHIPIISEENSDNKDNLELKDLIRFLNKLVSGRQISVRTTN